MLFSHRLPSEWKLFIKLKEKERRRRNRINILYQKNYQTEKIMKSVRQKEAIISLVEEEH